MPSLRRGAEDADRGAFPRDEAPQPPRQPWELPLHEQLRRREAPGPGGFLLRSVCPTPYALGPVCARGERELPNWRQAANSADLLGSYASMMADTVRYFFDVLASYRDVRSSIRLLSAADGCADDTQPDMQAKRVPTSVMLAHALTLCPGVWQDTRTHVRLYGGDVRNGVSPWWQPQQLPWQLPAWIDHRFVALDNTRDFVHQLYSTAQCEADMRFDVVLVRQGFCFCDDPSKTSTHWPCEVSITRAQPSTICGVYTLEPFLLEGRPAYRKDHCLLQWVTARVEWAVQDVAGGTWAFARGDVGHPALARGPWAVWDGSSHVNDATFACNLSPPQVQPPWQRPPNGRVCCCGVTGDTVSLLSMLQRVASVLDPKEANSFGLLHGAWTNGTKTEVDALHEQIKEAVRVYNECWRGAHAAAVLWRTAAKEYWLQCDGVVLFQPGSRADPWRAYTGMDYESLFAGCSMPFPI